MERAQNPDFKTDMKKVKLFQIRPQVTNRGFLDAPRRRVWLVCSETCFPNISKRNFFLNVTDAAFIGGMARFPISRICGGCSFEVLRLRDVG